MDKERLDGLLDYYKVLSDSHDNYHRLNNVANAIEKELGIEIPVCGTNDFFDSNDEEVCEPPEETNKNVQSENLFCSFCGKHSDFVKKLVKSGSGKNRVCICDDCAKVVVETLTDGI